MSRLTWRRQPNETGLSRVCQGYRDHELRFKGETIGHVSISGDSYYFYGCGKNSIITNEFFVDLKDAKLACKEWVISSEEFKSKLN